MSACRYSVLVALLLALAATVGAARPLVTVYKTSQPPQIDGVLDEPCWQAASLCRPFVSAEGRRLEAQNQARLIWDDGHLYVAVECFEPYLDPVLQQTDRVKALVRAHDVSIFGDDCVEIFFSPPGGSLFQFATNSIGTRWESRDGEVRWDCDWTVKAVRKSDRYVVECAIPLSALGLQGLAGGEWQGNFCRERKAVVEDSTWAGLQGAFNDRTQFGTLRFADSGPALRALQVNTTSPTRWVLTAEAFAPGSGADLQATVALRAADKPAGEFKLPLQRDAQGVARSQREILLPQEVLQSGKAAYGFTLTSAGTVVYASPLFPVAVVQSKAKLALAQSPGLQCEGFLNGKPIAAGEFELAPGLNVISMVASGAAGWVKPQIAIGSQRLPADGRWFCSAAKPSADWQTAPRVAGFAPATCVAQGLQVQAPVDGKVYFRRGVYVSPPTPRIFPSTDKVWLPVGTSQRVKPYLIVPPELGTTEYDLCLRVPSYLRYVSSDGIEGAKPQAVKEIGREQEGGRSYTLYRATYKPYPGTGMELSLRWGRAGGETIAYQPGITAGGTFDWSHFSTTVRAPAGAALLHPLVIKWQDRDITGTFWVDNIKIRRKGSTEDLLKVGDFEAPSWTHSYVIAGEGMNGSRALRVVSTTTNANQQQGIWLPEKAALKVEPGAEYTIEMDARAERLGSPKEKAMACLLFAVDGKAPPGEDRMWVNCETDGGNVTEVAQPVEVQVLPPLWAVRPKQIRISPCYYTEQNSDPAVLDALADNVWRSGMTSTYGGAENELVRLLRLKGPHECVLSLGYSPWETPTGMRDLLKEHPEVAAVEYPDKPSRLVICPTWMLSEGTEVLAALERQMADAVKSGLYQGADWDLEAPIIDPPTHCFCPRCFEAFRKEAGLSPDVKLTPEMMTKEYRQQWTHFRCGQNAQLAAHIRKGVKVGCPGIAFSMYSGTQSVYTMEHYGVDWSLLAPLLDEAVAGYNGDRKAIQDTIAALGKVPFMGGEMYYLSPTTASGAAPDPRTWRNRLLRQCVESGGVGVLIWWLPTMEGGAFYYTSEAAAVLARYETLFHQGQRCDQRVKVVGIPANDWFALSHGQDRLILLLNFASQPVKVKVSPPTDWRGLSLVDPISGANAPGQIGRPTLLEIPAYGVRVVKAVGQ